MSLIEELYSSKAVDLIRDLYNEDHESKQAFYEAFGNKILEQHDKILLSKPLDILMLICTTAKFASSHEECQNVAVIIYKRLQEKNPLPYILDDNGINLAEKSFTSLSFFYPALLKRWKKGAPHPHFYRECSKRLFEQRGYTDIANHHEQWEEFFSEIFI